MSSGLFNGIFNKKKKAQMGCWKQLKDDMEEGSDEHIQQI